MSSRPIAYNLVRLVMSSIHSTPRGVDRIDFGYLSSLLDHWPGEVVGVMPTIIGLRYFGREEMLRGRERLKALWQEDMPAERDPALARLMQRMAQPDLTDSPGKPRRHLPDLEGLKRMAQLVLAEGIKFGKPVRQMPRDAIYLDIGHFGLTFPGAFRWRASRPDVIPVFMIHDAIPVEFPHMVAPETVASYEKLIRVVAAHARAILTPTQAAGVAVNAALSQRGFAPVQHFANPLAIDDAFLNASPLPEALTDKPYFVICGAVEPRKNHALLFEVWRGLIARCGDAAPTLVIAGASGFRGREILTEALEDNALRRHVILAPGLGTPALAGVMARARALLMPSFAEGFGLPPVEAMAMGTPTLLSDIPAHREAAGPLGRFFAPEDANVWREAILDLLDDGKHAAERERIKPFRPSSWPEHMDRATRFLSTI